MTNPDHYKPLPGINTFIINSNVHALVSKGNVRFVAIDEGPIVMSEWDFGEFVSQHLQKRVELKDKK